MQVRRPHNQQQSIIGREEERRRLRAALDAARAGSGRLVLVSGEAGIGKTVLIDELASAAAEQGALALVGGCYDLTMTPPYGPWTELLRAYSGPPDFPSVPQKFREEGEIESVGSQGQLFRIVADFLTEVARVCPLVLILEDLHWADHASLDLLRFLARQVTRQRLLLLVRYRDEELNRDHPLFTALPLLIRESRAERLELPPFDAETLRMFIGSQYALPNADLRTLSAYLLQYTEGNPLFAAEVLRSLARARVLAETTEGWRLAELGERVPPPLVVQMIERQLAVLDDATRSALEVASVLGQEIRLDLWQRLSGLDDEALSAVIEQGLIGRVLEPQRDSGLRFRHALIREVLYRSMVFATRRRVHQQAAECLLETGAPDPDAVASHFQRAGDERAAHWLIEAGYRAARVWAAFAALERYEAALRLLEHDDARLRERGWLLVSLALTSREAAAGQAIAYAEGARRVAEQLDDELLAAWAWWAHGTARFFAGENGLPELERGLAALRDLLPSAFDRLPARFQHFDLDYMESTIIFMHAFFGSYREALVGANRYLDSVLPPETPFFWHEWAHAEAALANVRSAMGDADGAGEAFRRAKDAYRNGGSTWYEALTATAELQYVTLTYQADQLAQRRRLTAEVEALWSEVSGITTAIPPRFGLLPLLVVEGVWPEAREIATPFAERGLVFHDIALLALGLIARAQGEMDLAWRQVRTRFPEGPDIQPGTHPALSTLELYRLAGKLALDAGDLEVARRWIETHDRWLAWSGRVQGRAEAQLLWARYHQIAGDARQARRHAERSREHAADPRQPLALLAAHRFLGSLDALAGRVDTAREQLDIALGLASACAAPYEQALTLLALAELGAATGRADEAWAQVDQVRALGTPLEAKPTLQRAGAVAAKLAVRRGKPVHPAGLTPREVEVLQLVANGLTDADVGARLFVSPRTVNSHLTSIYTKLGVSSRVEAARFAIEHGLTGPSSR